MNPNLSENKANPPILVNAERVEFISDHDGLRDWYLIVPGKLDKP